MHHHRQPCYDPQENSTRMVLIQCLHPQATETCEEKHQFVYSQSRVSTACSSDAHSCTTPLKTNSSLDIQSALPHPSWWSLLACSHVVHT
uniref:Uncharacterized protein n=1 Tax=Rhizophora mucronata TaxID=61149 RepID=A0A2P2IR35_RHIMU